MQAKYRIDRWLEIYKKINYWLLVPPMIALAVMFVLDSANVTTIRLFGFRATPFQKDVIEQLIIPVVYVALAYVLIGPGHIKTDILKRKFSPPLRFIADMINDLAIIFLSTFCAYATGAGAIHTIAVQQRTMGLVDIPLSPFFVALTFGWLLLAIAAVLVMIQHIVYFKGGEYHKPIETAPVKDVELVKA